MLVGDGVGEPKPQDVEGQEEVGAAERREIAPKKNKKQGGVKRHEFVSAVVSDTSVEVAMSWHRGPGNRQSSRFRGRVSMGRRSGCVLLTGGARRG